MHAWQAQTPPLSSTGASSATPAPQACMHAYYACVLCMRTMHAYYACVACMRTMHACVRFMYVFSFCFFCSIAEVLEESQAEALEESQAPGGLSGSVDRSPPMERGRSRSERRQWSDWRTRPDWWLEPREWPSQALKKLRHLFENHGGIN